MEAAALIKATGTILKVNYLIVHNVIAQEH